MSVGVWLLLSLSALCAEKRPETLKQAILEAIDLSAGQHVFAQGGKGGAKAAWARYDRVVIRGSKLADGSMRVVFDRTPADAETTADVFHVDFSALGTKPRPAKPPPANLPVIPENERRACAAVKAVMDKCLGDKETDLSWWVSVTRKKQETVVLVTFSLMVGAHRLFVLNESNEIVVDSPGL